MSKGLIYIFTGNGKGKTSAALGVAIRALLLDKKVVWISFYKEESWGMAEKGLREKFPNLDMKFTGRGFKIDDSRFKNGKIKIAPVGKAGNIVLDKASEEEHKQAAESGLKLIEKNLKGKPFLLVADEILNAVSEGLLEENDVIKLLKSRGETYIVLTGRSDPSGRLPEGIMDMADLVTECKKVKHPYDQGELAVRGLDY